jgi:hypothetical protein
LRGVFDKEGKNRKGRDDFRNEEEIYQSRWCFMESKKQTKEWVSRIVSTYEWIL